MSFWGFLSHYSEVPLPRIILFAGISGLSNAALLMLVNRAAHTPGKAEEDYATALQFIVALLIYVLTQRYMLRISTVEVEKIVAKLRIRLSDKIRRADLPAIESLGRAPLYHSVHTDTLTISQATAPLMIAAQGAILVVFSLGYIYSLATSAFLLTVVIVALGISVHFANKKKLMAELEQSTNKENEFFDALTHLLDGFKEVKLNSARSRDLYRHLRQITTSVADLKTRTGVRYAEYYLFTQVVFYLLIGAMAFMLPASVNQTQVTQITASILFIIGPLTMVVGAVPVFQNASHAVAKIVQLEDALTLADDLSRARDNGEIVVAPPFERIALRGTTFSYKDAGGRPVFEVGPLDLTITRGEILFVTGGNGSGKSTFFKLLTTLYHPDSGKILLDGESVETVGYRPYRELFSAIFNDYHLFSRLYGLAVQEDQVQDLLQLMELSDKTDYADGRFGHQDLSTGQKKRLALIVSLLEDKPIYIFDEWAADQDPGFREFFYKTLLPDLKAREKTVIAATHDDRYFSVADRRVKMELGKIVSIENGKPS